MKRGYIIIVAAVGVAAGAFLALQGTSYDLSQYWQYILSLWRRVVTKTESAVTADGYTKALDLIAGFEGFSAKAYPDANGYSIGYGHFIREGDPYDQSSEISEAEAYTLLEQDARSAQACVSGAVRVSLTVGQQAALISFVYNVGCEAFRESTLLKMLNTGDYAGASGQFSRWNKSQGLPLQALTDRRASEQEVFNS